MTDFLGLVAVVTGGASGIGAATARLLQARGARVAVLDREVAHAIASLASPSAASTTGTVLRVDGGMTSLRL